MLTQDIRDIAAANIKIFYGRGKLISNNFWQILYFDEFYGLINCSFIFISSNQKTFRFKNHQLFWHFDLFSFFHDFLLRVWACDSGVWPSLLMLINAISFNRPNPPPTPGVGCSGHVTRGVKSENQIYRTNGFLSGNNSDAPQKFDV